MEHKQGAEEFSLFITENHSNIRLFNYKTKIHYRESFKYKIIQLQKYASTKPTLSERQSSCAGGSWRTAKRMDMNVKIF